jgi:ribonuclease D
MHPTTIFDTELAGGCSATRGSGSARSSPRSSASPWRRGTRRRLVHPAAPGVVAALRRAGRRGAARAAGRAGARARGHGKIEWAREEFAAIVAAPPAAARVEPWRRTSGCTAYAAPPARSRPRAVGGPRPARRRRDTAPGAYSRTPRSSRPRSPCLVRRPSSPRCRCSAAARRDGSPAPGSPPWSRHARCRTPTCRPDRRDRGAAPRPRLADRDPAAAARLSAAPGRRRRDRRRAPPADREPHCPRHHPAAVLAAPRAGRRGVGRRVPAQPRSDAPGRSADHRRAARRPRPRVRPPLTPPR